MDGLQLQSSPQCTKILFLEAKVYKILSNAAMNRNLSRGSCEMEWMCCRLRWSSANVQMMEYFSSCTKLNLNDSDADSEDEGKIWERWYFHPGSCLVQLHRLNIKPVSNKIIMIKHIEIRFLCDATRVGKGFPLAPCWKSVHSCRCAQSGSASPQTGFVRYSGIIPLCALPVTQWFIKICCKQFWSLLSHHAHANEQFSIWVLNHWHWLVAAADKTRWCFFSITGKFETILTGHGT